jgi:hypothetical protein
MGVRPGTDLPCQGSHGSSSRLGATRRPTTSSSSGVWAAAGPVAMEVDEKEEEAEALAERYALGGACKVLMGTPALLRATPLTGGVNFVVYSCWVRSTSLGSVSMRGRWARSPPCWREVLAALTAFLPLDAAASHTRAQLWWEVFDGGGALHRLRR